MQWCEKQQWRWLNGQQHHKSLLWLAVATRAGGLVISGVVRHRDLTVNRYSLTFCRMVFRKFWWDPGQFAPWRAWKFCSLKLSLTGTFIPETLALLSKLAWDISLPGTFVLKSICSQELSIPGTFVPSYTMRLICASLPI